VMFQA